MGEGRQEEKYNLQRPGLLTLNLTDGHLDAPLAAFPGIFRGVVIGQYPPAEKEPPRLPTCKRKSEVSGTAWVGGAPLGPGRGSDGGCGPGATKLTVQGNLREAVVRKDLYV